jgi:dTDP-4-amino-4,6-dideoxygalactose transaminase
VPLHSSPAGRRFGRHGDALTVTDDISGRLIRMPMWVELPHGAAARVVDEIARCAAGPRFVAAAARVVGQGG